jgi:hypothetical protein
LSGMLDENLCEFIESGVVHRRKGGVRA